jgi:hypothetical protein
MKAKIVEISERIPSAMTLTASGSGMPETIITLEIEPTISSKMLWHSLHVSADVLPAGFELGDEFRIHFERVK